MAKKELLLDDELITIAGGQSKEPEEFEWKRKGYQTPIKDQPEYNGWKFEAISDIKNKYKEISGGALEDVQIDIGKLNAIIKILTSSFDKTYDAIIQIIIDVLQEYGKDAAIEITNRLLGNNEEVRKAIIQTLNTSKY